MTSQLDTAPNSSGRELGGGGSGGDITALDPFVCQDMRWCVNCGGEQVFVEVFEFDGGRMGVCLGCGDERIAPFSRTIAEVA
jgi:hypothetical protein